MPEVLQQIVRRSLLTWFAMKKFSSFNIRGRKHFLWYSVHQFPIYPPQFEFRIFSPCPDPGRWFTANFIKMNGYALSESLSDNGFGEFSLMGIPEAIIPIASEELDCAIRSLPITGKPGTFLTGEEYQVWERLCNKNSSAGFEMTLNCFVLEKKPVGLHGMG